MSEPRMTPARLRVLTVLAERERMTAADVAHALWPDSPAWKRRGHWPGANRNAAAGAALPMNAGRILWSLEPWYVEQSGGWWSINDHGRKMLAGEPNGD